MSHPVTTSASAFDSSVVLAVALAERIELSLPPFRTTLCSAVNAAEIGTRLFGTPTAIREAGLRILNLMEIVPFTASQAQLAADLRSLGRNISLGDRACLALALEAQAVVYTADRAWADFRLPLTIHIIR